MGTRVNLQLISKIEKNTMFFKNTFKHAIGPSNQNSPKYGDELGDSISHHGL